MNLSEKCKQLEKLLAEASKERNEYYDKCREEQNRVNELECALDRTKRELRSRELDQNELHGMVLGMNIVLDRYAPSSSNISVEHTENEVRPSIAPLHFSND